MTPSSLLSTGSVTERVLENCSVSINLTEPFFAARTRRSHAIASSVEPLFLLDTASPQRIYLDIFRFALSPVGERSCHLQEIVYRSSKAVRFFF
jgi:hypothetical protein